MPVIGIVVFGLLMALLALVFDLEALVQFLSIGTLLAYTFVAASIIVLRFQQQKAGAPTQPAGSRPSPEPCEGPAASELKEYESFSDKLQLVDRDKGKEHREPGQLKAAFEPYLEFLSDFYPGEVVTVAVVTLMVSAICLCSILVFGNTHLHLPTWSYSLLLVLFSLGFLLSLLLIWVHEQQRSTQTFQVRLGPWAGTRQGVSSAAGPSRACGHPDLVKALQLLRKRQEEQGVSEHWVWGVAVSSVTWQAGHRGCGSRWSWERQSSDSEGTLRHGGREAVRHVILDCNIKKVVLERSCSLGNA